MPPPPIWDATQPPIPVQPRSSQSPVAGHRCPRCGTPSLPEVRKKISSDGWLVFIILLFLCTPFFWVGLLMKKTYSVCPVCQAELS